MNEQSWDEITSSTRVVATREEALAGCSSKRIPPNKLFFVIKGLAKFWRWNLPILLGVWVASLLLRTMSTMAMAVTITTPWMKDFQSLLLGFLLRDATWLLNLSSDGSESYSFGRLAVAVGRLFLATVILAVLRLLQRLSWRTTEFGTYPSVKDNPIYQNEKLLNEAWASALKHQGSLDPTKCNDFEEGIGGGNVLMQPSPGYCAVSTLNSVLRSFKDHKRSKPSAPPYVTIHPTKRYVTMDQMETLLRTICSGGAKSKWANGGGGPVESIQVLRCGGPNDSISTPTQFREALRQLSHPTQPARIMAIYSRSPLFFCSDSSNNNGCVSKIAAFVAAVHWSPVLAYREEDDAVLVMDVNHTYGSRGYLVPVERFYDAVRTRDMFDGERHGLIVLRPSLPSTCLTRGTRSGELPLLSNPEDLSLAFGTLKKAYYEHQAAGRRVSVLDILDSKEGGYEERVDEDFEERCIRLVSPGGGGGGGGSSDDSGTVADGGLSAIVSGHPVFFANEIFLEPGRVPSLESLKSIISVFSQLRVPARIVVRGYDKSALRKVHRVLMAAGMVPLLKGTRVMFLNLNTARTHLVQKSSIKERLPQGYYIEEVVWDPKNKKGNSLLVASLGKLIQESYKLSAVNRRGCTPGEFNGRAYQTFSHGGNLRHFACYESASKEMVSCVALFCDRSGKDGTRPDIAGMFNVCTSPNHRRKGLGRTMSLYAIEESRKAGCKQVMLEASKAGKPIYESIGFATMTDKSGGVYALLSIATDDFKWKNIFRLLQLYFRIKNSF